ncbi:MAG: nitroreductase family protein, partial [Arsenophonus sp. ER-BJ3-MAG3]
MTLNDAVARRHTVKAFEGGKSLPQDEIETLLNVLRNSPSSVNSQPWHFVVASTEAGREQIAASTDGAFAYNSPKVRNASHVIALCIRTDLDEAHLQNVLAQEDADGRYAKPESKANN